MIYNKITQLLSRIVRRVRLSLVSTQKEFSPTVQLFFQGGSANSEYIAPYGFNYSPPPGSVGVMWNIAGNSDDRVCMLWKLDGMPKLEIPGEVKVGSPEFGTFIYFKADGSIEIKASTVNVKADIVNLGEGGESIARLGDSVQVDTGTGIGTITSGGVNKSI